MPQSLASHYPPTLTTEQLEFVLASIRDWAINYGLAVRPSPGLASEPSNVSELAAVPAPITLWPSLFPRTCFEEALSLQTGFNELYCNIAADEQWLAGIVQELVEVDDFISRLWQVHLKVKSEGYVQDLCLGLFRSDYMAHVDDQKTQKTLQIKQVEFNTIASSFGGLSQEVGLLHKFLLASGAYPDRSAPDTTQPSLLDARSLPANRSISGLAAGLAAAHVAYANSMDNVLSDNTFKQKLCIVFVVQTHERNVFDQRKIEYALLAEHGIVSFRVAFDRIQDELALDDERNLGYSAVRSPQQRWLVSTVYFRAGYSPDEYTTDAHWDARHLLERSRAIKCPTILTQLAGSKKIQQVLATPGSRHLESFITDVAKVDSLRRTFAPIYPMDQSEAGQEARKLALDSSTARKYVLKPQREGGGNNVYRENIPTFLKQLPEASWPAWILMEMIETQPARNIIYRNGEVQEGGVIGELGVYGACLWSSSKTRLGKPEILYNTEAGHLLRTKGDTSEEGGVAAGFGAVDSCCLIDV